MVCHLRLWTHLRKPTWTWARRPRLHVCTRIDGTDAVLDIQGAVMVIYIYQLIDGDVKVEKLEYRKPAPVDVNHST